MPSRTVLMVEDQIDFLAVQKIFFERHGYRVFAAEDGLAALEAAREHLPDVIVMDLSLPNLDGLGATRELKRDPKTRGIPVLMLTAHGYGSAGRRAREAGCAGFIPKPCDPRRVLREVEQLIGPSQTSLH
jgi:two-component system, cell cycle response regulator DivK